MSDSLFAGGPSPTEPISSPIDLMSSHPELDRTLTVNEIVKRVPSALVTLSANGIDTCCRGHESLDHAAAEAGIDPNALLAQIATPPRNLPVAKQCSGRCDDCSEKHS